MKLPSSSECAAIFERYVVPEHILLHCRAVQKVANAVATGIISRGGKVDAACVDRAAFLHDVMKMHCIKNNCAHAQEAQKLLASLGYKELGEIVRLHNLEDIKNFTRSTPLEAKIVWYADKRVNHYAIVSLAERYAYLKERYGSQSAEKMREISSTQKPAEKLEKELALLAGLDEAFLRGGW